MIDYKTKINTCRNIDKLLTLYLKDYYNMRSDEVKSLDRDAIVNSNDIVSVISSRIELNRFNKAKCPFHDDSNASLSVHPQKQIFKCFGCGASGSVIDFIMLYDKVDFRTALKILGG